jgi:(S)-2-hydroxyglutarate dehydrogenase
MKIIVIGGGIVGLATANQILDSYPETNLTLIEKEDDVCTHQSGHNSGVLHAGLYYRPGSRKAKYAVSGLKKMVAFCEAHEIPYDLCGKLVVATNLEEKNTLVRLHERGIKNGLRGLRLIAKEELADIEPNVVGIAGIHVPEEGIIDYPAVCRKLKDLISSKGGIFSFKSKVASIVPKNYGWLVGTDNGDFFSDRVVTCAGLYSDKMVSVTGFKAVSKIIPFRGEYYKLKKESEYLVRNLIYPVPDTKYPFLGVHFTRLIGGGIEAGPNAVLAFAREGYTIKDINVAEMYDYLSYKGFWRFIINNPKLIGYELYRSLSRSEFCRSLQKLVPKIQESDLQEGGAGVRAQAMSSLGALVEDFEYFEKSGLIHLINAPSPAATAAFSLANDIVSKILL